jgi:hypothetical protein
MKKIFFTAGVLSLLAFMVTVGVIRADIAPPLQPPGAILGPADFAKTDIQMALESVTIYVEEAGRLYYGSTDADTVNGRVTATFAMANPGQDELTSDVVFPLMNIDGSGDGRFAYPEIQNFNVSVNYENTVWETVTTPNPRGEDQEPIKWVQFTVTFLTGELTFIDVSYDVQSTGYLPIAAFSYVMETGTAWAGPIGEAYLTLVLPYEASEENVLIGEDVYFGMGGENNPEPEFDGNKVKWQWSNLEPTREDNWGVAIIAPHIWQEVIDLREEMAQGKRGAASEITLWYDGLIIDRGIRQGTEELIGLNIEAYKQAMVESEFDDEVRARYANFLLFLYGYGRESDKYPGMLDEIYQLAREAQAMDQFNPTALDVLNQLEKVYNYVPPAEEPGLTVTEYLKPSGEESVEISTTSKKADNNTLIFILGGALVVALLVIIFLVFRMRHIKGQSKT